MSELPTSKNVTRWKCVGYCRHCTADNDESTFSKEWGHFEQSEGGVWVRADSALAEIDRLRALLREVGSEVSAVGCEGADDAICIESTMPKEDWCPYCRIGTIVQNAASPAETPARSEP